PGRAGQYQKKGGSFRGVAPAASSRGRGFLLFAGFFKERPGLGHYLPALFAPLRQELRDRRFRGFGQAGRNGRSHGRRFSWGEPAARPVSGGAPAEKPFFSKHPGMS